jgi:hypothetical protein
MGVCDFWKHLHLIEINLLYECKVSWNKIVKGIKIFVLKGFGVTVKVMVGEWCGILVIHIY